MSEPGPDDDVSDREKALLEQVPARAPPPGFAARVMAEQRRRAARRWLASGGAAAAAAVLVVGLLSAPRTPATGGQLAAARERASLTLGQRGVAVAEPGSALSWAVASDGAAAVQQSAGNVFYRVEPGGAFVVSSSAGEVRVTGTCFRVEVSDVKTSSLASAAAGALVATVMTVTVYEGGVLAAAPGQPAVALTPGEAATLDGRTVAVAASARAPSAAKSPATGRAAPGARAPLPADLDPAALYRAHAVLTEEADALRAQVDTLRAELQKATQDRTPTKLEPSPEELQALARSCRLRWDTISLSADNGGMPVAVAEQIGLSEEERAAIEQHMSAHRKQLVDQIRALYVETTGDPNAGSMAAEAMQVEIVDKAPPGEIKRTFQRLARERAGLPVPPLAPGQVEPPVTRLYRALTSSGDVLEASIAAELGAETAHRARKAREGWGSQHGSSYGCPAE